VEKIKLDVWLYGTLSRYGGDGRKKSYANLQVELPAGSTIADLLDNLSLPTEERGLTFINGDLSAMPDLQPDLEDPLKDGDRVAFFHLQSMWPAQYRHGVDLAPSMSEEIGPGKKIFHHRSRT
jgi:sulfur carrier protein ThiS